LTAEKIPKIFAASESRCRDAGESWKCF